ncbi:MAG: choloylglycine hydrolase [Tissierellia bacterium]|nr:choloylglycine hydrolase [Tissierellia bacterium]
MCTFFKLVGDSFYIGRNMDIEYSFGEELVITPRNYEWKWRNAAPKSKNYAIIGMATVDENYPLYAEGANEHGLVMASLNFPGNAKFFPKMEGKLNLTPFEFIPYILSNFKTVKEVREIAKDINLIDEAFKESMPLAPLHFILADKDEALVFEQEADGMHIYDNPIGILTNNPQFDRHMDNLQNYTNLRVENPKTSFAKSFEPKPYGQGLGAVGLPGDASPMSRFVRTAFYKLTTEELEKSNINHLQVFHILDAVKMLRGSVKTPDDKWDITTYSACIDASRGIYYFKTYDNPQIYDVKLHNENLDSKNLIKFPLPKEFESKSLN